MPSIPIRIGNLTALIPLPEKPGCSHPGCKWPDKHRCGYQVLRAGKVASCGAKLCGNHASPSTLAGHICQPHKKLMERESSK